ncbi:MAG: Trk system potassium transporter TrkA [Rectinema sp.]|nr:Trk system potassium transporter TrkA [Rectinema sp.]
MKVAILGAGLLGSLIARELITEDRDVVIIEKNPNIARTIANDLDCIVEEGDGERLDTLTAAGVADADWFIACTGSDETNIVSCGIVAESFKNVRTIARTRNPYFATFRNTGRRILGVDQLLNPDAETAEAIARIIYRGMSPEIIDVKEAGIQMRRILCNEESRFPGRVLADVRLSIGPEFMIPAVVRHGELIVPTGNFLFEKDDFAYILGEPSALDRLFGPCKSTIRKFRSMVIFGAEALTSLLLQELGIEMVSAASHHKARNRQVLSLLGNPKIKVIDGRKEFLKSLSTAFPDIEPIERQLSEEHIFEEENIGNADIVLCLTSHQTINILTAQLAKQKGARRVMTLVTNDLYAPILDSMNIDIIINEKTVMAGTILDKVRKAKIRRLYSFPQNEYELIEIQISKSFEKLGWKIKDLNLPKGFLITFVIHEGKTIVPTGHTEIYENDLIGLIIKKEEIGRLESIFGA